MLSAAVLRVIYARCHVIIATLNVVMLCAFAPYHQWCHDILSTCQCANPTIFTRRKERENERLVCYIGILDFIRETVFDEKAS